MRFPKTRLFSTLLLTAIPTVAFAASDGTLGATSTGTSTITVTVPNLIRITGMADFSFGTYSGSGDMDQNDNVCVYTNKASGTYRVTASGSGAGGAFSVASGADTLAYGVFFNDVSGTTGEQALTSGSALTGQSGANTTSQTCGGSDNANIHVRFLETNLTAAPAGSYTGTLTIVVEPV